MDVTLPDVVKPILEIYGISTPAVALAFFLVRYGTPFVRDKMLSPAVLYGLRTDLVALGLGIGGYWLGVRPVTVEGWLTGLLGGVLAWAIAAGKYKLDKTKEA